MFSTVKCKKCRGTLFDNSECHSLLVNAHNLLRTTTEHTESCSTVAEENLLFVSEDSLPEWIRKSVEDNNWAKGKLNCKHCDARIGAFDFVSGIKCDCKEFVLPAVHVIKSKVDVLTSLNT